MLPRVFLVFVLCVGLAHAHSLEIVMIDEAAEKALGGFPVDRAIMAQMIEKIEHAGARSIVIKFFFDQPAKKPASDDALEAVLRASKIPIILQARIDETELQSNPLETKFALPSLKLAPEAALSGTHGWIPPPRFAHYAAAVAFIDELNPAPILTVYRGRTYPSLYLSAAESILGEKLTIEPNVQLSLGSRTVPLDARNRVQLPYPKRDTLDYVPALDVLHDVPSLARLRGKVVLLAYDGSQMHTFPTPIGPIKAHRLFYYELLALCDALGARESVH